MNTHEEARTMEATADRRRRVLLLAIPAGAAAAAVGLLLATGGIGPKGASEEALELTLPDAGGAMASCLPFTVEYLAGMSPAFEATVTAVTDERVALDVDRWFAGGSAATAVLTIPPEAHAALIGEIDFREGERYLITASDGAVNMCGYSGEATPEMVAAFEVAF